LINVAIIGGGAAGIGAARRLAASRRSTLLLEASDRLGGRAWTLETGGMPLDLGCGWLHSADRNPWVRIAEAAGLTINRTRTAWGQQWRNLGFNADEQAAAGDAYDAFEQRLRQSPPASDRASDALPAGGEWNGFIDTLSGYINGAGLRSLSVADYLAYDDHATEVNWRLPAGYGTLVARSMPVIPFHLATPVSRIELTRAGVRIDTARGAIEAGAAIVCVSTSALTSGRLALPPEAQRNLEAAARLPLGLANKLFLAIDGADDLDPDTHLLGNPRAAETGSYYLRPFGRAVIEVFLGGEGAEDLEAAGFDGAAAFAIDELANLLGNDWQKRLRLIAGSAWGVTDWIGGSYSHALPGSADQRALLATPVANRLFFAGEACSPHDFSTAHGALQSGIAAADAALAALG
jgi:monoamine oxidase